MPRFTFENTKPVISDQELLGDLSRVALYFGVSTLPQRKYRRYGRYSTTAIKQRFGSWNRAATAAGLGNSAERDIAEEILNSNIEAVWVHLGRQPRKRDMRAPISRFSHHPYVRRYGGWLNAIRAFLRTVDTDDRPEELVVSRSEQKAAGPREPSLRLRFFVMRQDRFACRHCGASPAKDPKVELHVDHIVPWSEGGPTVFENLQTLCVQCNLGKGDLPEQVSNPRSI